VVKIFVMLTILQKAVENGMWKKLFHNCYIFLPNWVGHTTFFSCLEVDKNWLKLMLRETGGKTSLKTRLDVFLFSPSLFSWKKRFKKAVTSQAFDGQKASSSFRMFRIRPKVYILVFGEITAQFQKLPLRALTPYQNINNVM